MGIESDKLIYDYLGKVADLAQTSLGADERARLIAGLRRDIDEQRSGVRDRPAAVRRVLSRLGAPEEVVRRAASGGLPAPRPAPATQAPAPAPAAPAAGPSVPVPQQKAAERHPEWWRVPGSPAAAVPEEGPGGPVSLPPPGAFPGWDEVEFDFGAEPEPPAAEADPVPEEPKPRKRRVKTAEPETAKPEAAEAEPEAAPAPARRLGRPLLLETVAAVLLAAGVVLGSVLPMLLGWLIAYASRGLGAVARKFAVLGIPALTVLAAGVWFWGRSTGRWGGAPLTGDHLKQSLKDTGPVLIRVAGAGSAAFLLWAAFRRRRVG